MTENLISRDDTFNYNQALRLIGLNSYTTKSKPIFDSVRLLKPGFDTLFVGLPNLEKTISIFRNIDLIERHYNEQLELLKANDQIPSNFLKYLIDLPKLETEIVEIIRKYIAFIWLLNSIQHSTDAIAELIAPLDLEGLLSAFIISVFTSDVEQLTPSLVALPPLNPSNFRSWAEAFTSNVKKICNHQITKDFTANKVFELLTALSNVNEGSAFVLQSKKRTAAPTRGNALPDRQKRITTIGSFKEVEVEILANELKSSLEVESNKYLPSDFYCALLASLSLATGRTIEELLTVPVILIKKNRNSLNEELKRIQGHIAVDLRARSGVVATFNLIFQGQLVQLHLPKNLASNLKVLIKTSVERLDAVYPFSYVPWPERVESWLKSLLPECDNVLLKVRDTLTRELFKNSANPAVLTVLTSDPESWRKSESLSNYHLNPAAYLESHYQKATRAIFQLNPVALRLDELSSLEFFNAQRVISIYLKEKVASDFDNVWEQHNAYAHYVLMLLVVASGHRASTTPFYFSWDINEAEGLAFICDKVVVGSEARFVPLPEWLMETVTAYRCHLLRLSIKLKSDHPELSVRIAQVASQQQQAQQEESAEALPEFGLFFSLNEHGNPKTITTQNLEEYYQPASDVKVAMFRKHLTTYCLHAGLSGMQVEALLGHQTRQHIFGKSSAWSIKGWADRVRPIQTDYLEQGGWKAIAISGVRNNLSEFKKGVPYFQTERPKQAYEARVHQNRAAIKRAKHAVDLVIPSWWLEVGNVVRDDDFAEVQESAKVLLKNDPIAQEKVNAILAKKRRKLSGFNTISSTVFNNYRYELGPVSVSASRYVAIATAVREWWFSQLKLAHKVTNAAALIENIGLSLIINDAVLDEPLWEQYLTAIIQQKVERVNETLFLHVEHGNHKSTFEKTLIASPITSAFILSYVKNVKPEKVNEEGEDESSRYETELKPIKSSIRKSLKKTLKYTLSVSELIAVFSSWWQMRLPGALFAVATGENNGPSVDLVTQKKLLNETETPADASKKINQLAKTLVHQLNKPLLSDSTEVINAIKDIFTGARGKISNQNKNSRTQKLNFKQRLQTTLAGDQSILSRALLEQEIVQIYLLYLEHLFKEGGIRNKGLKFGSIDNYVHSTLPLISLFWDKNLHGMDAEEYRQLYKACLDAQPTPEPGRLQFFHQILRDEIDAPYIRLVNGKLGLPTRVRGMLLTAREYDATDKLLQCLQDNDPELATYARVVLMLGYHSGMRRSEIYGIELKALSFKNNNQLKIDVTSNPVRNLKSAAARRRIHGDLEVSKQTSNVLKALLNERSLIEPSNLGSRKKRLYLFKDDAETAQLFSDTKIDQCILQAIRGLTGNNHFVMHGLRHTAATRLASRAIISPRSIPVSEITNNTINSTTEDYFEQVFEGGFHRWPFWIDEVAMQLGHADSNTLLDVYWHNTALKLAEFTWAENGELEMLKDDALAALLGLDRTSIVKHRKARQKDLETGSRLSVESTILNYVQTSKIGQQEVKQPKSKANWTGGFKSTSQSNSTNWLVYDALLTKRHEDGSDKDALKEDAQTVNIEAEQFDVFYSCYTILMAETGFIDFEPENSPIIGSNTQIRAGVLHGKAERHKSLKTIQRFWQKDKVFKQKIEQFCLIWRTRVDQKNPWFVARSSQEVKLIYDVLIGIGAQVEQLEMIERSGFDYSKWTAPFPANLVESKSTSDKTFSRINQDIKIQEFGIRVKQLAGAGLGDGRDTHRLIFITTLMIEHITQTQF